MSWLSYICMQINLHLLDICIYTHRQLLQILKKKCNKQTCSASQLKEKNIKEDTNTVKDGAECFVEQRQEGRGRKDGWGSGNSGRRHSSNRYVSLKDMSLGTIPLLSQQFG